MNVFRLHAEKEQGAMRVAGTWLVVADNLFDAISLVPEGLCVKAVEIEAAPVAGPGRVIGRLPTLH